MRKMSSVRWRVGDNGEGLGRDRTIKEFKGDS